MQNSAMTSKRNKPAESWMRNALRDGFRALQAGDTDQAGACCRRVLETRQDLPEAHFLVGLVALELEQRKVCLLYTSDAADECPAV